MTCFTDGALEVISDGRAIGTSVGRWLLDGDARTQIKTLTLATN
jgi:hypothetical protein